MEYEAVIGLEVHAQLLTRSKIFCSCPTSFGDEPNSNTCPVCLGFPGALPVLNRKAVDFACRAALAVNCQIAHVSTFARKNYFYPDLPKGYQISQYELPLASSGHVVIESKGRSKKIGLVRIHLEEDTGKNLHEEGSRDIGGSWVDLNRAGTPLIEIVSEPHISSSTEASAYLKALRQILIYLEICDGNMEEGSFRCDANVSIRPKGSSRLGTKIELKNLNSFKFIQKALDFEIERQREILKSGGELIQETRLWDSDAGKTYPMRLKEEAHDYRYFPDPDLILLQISEEWIDKIKKDLPELPFEKKKRFISTYSIPDYDAEILINSKDLADYFEECVALYNKPKIVSNWIMGDLLRELKNDRKDIQACAVTPKHLGEMLNFLDQGIISGKIAKYIFEKMYKTGKMPKSIIEEEGLVQITDEGEIEKCILEILAANSKQVEAYRAGKTKLLGYFVGQVMKATQGKANPKIVNKILKKHLDGM